MEKAPGGTSVGVEDPYAHVDRCDHLTSGGRCRFARERGDWDPDFAAARREEDFQCPVAGDPTEEGATGPWEWTDCPHFRCRSHDRACVRCGLEERRNAHGDDRPLLEKHHLSYATGDREGRTPDHEITVFLCRWCHAKVHQSWARVDDDARPEPAAIAEREGRRSRELAELAFETAADRSDRGE